MSSNFPKCPICSEYFCSDGKGNSAPKSISCGHTFCSTCISKLFERNDQRSILCLLCQKEILCNSVSEIPVNYQMCDIVGQLQSLNFYQFNVPRAQSMSSISSSSTLSVSLSSSTLSSSTLSSSALSSSTLSSSALSSSTLSSSTLSSSPLSSSRFLTNCYECESSAAKIYCPMCNCYLCIQCGESIHSSKILQSHKKLFRLTNQYSKKARNKSTPKCPQHNKRLDIYCKSCEELICSFCSSHGPHKTHKTEIASDMAPLTRNIVSICLDNLKQHEKQALVLSKSLEQQNQDVLTSNETFQNLLLKQKNELIVLIEQQYKKLQDQAAVLVEERIRKSTLDSNRVNQLINEIRDTSSQAKDLLVTNDFSLLKQTSTVNAMTGKIQQYINSLTDFTLVSSTTLKVSDIFPIIKQQLQQHWDIHCLSIPTNLKVELEERTYQVVIHWFTSQKKNAEMIYNVEMAIKEGMLPEWNLVWSGTGCTCRIPFACLLRATRILFRVKSAVDDWKNEYSSVAELYVPVNIIQSLTFDIFESYTPHRVALSNLSVIATSNNRRYSWIWGYAFGKEVVRKGKYIWHLKINACNSSLGIGIFQQERIASLKDRGESYSYPGSYIVMKNGLVFENGKCTQTENRVAFLTGDIVVVELDCTNNKMTIICEARQTNTTFQLPSNQGWKLHVALEFGRNQVEILPTLK